MICVSLQRENVDELVSILSGLTLAEVRFEKLALAGGDMDRIMGTGCAVVATNRPAGKPETERAALLIAAIRAGATYVDVELEASDDFCARVHDAATECGCRFIVSYHNYDETPSASALNDIVDQCFAKGADVAKVACQTKGSGDAARLLGLLDTDKSVLPIGMGEAGRTTRLVGPLLGSPFTFAALESGRETAPGQYSLEELTRIYREMGVQV